MTRLDIYIREDRNSVQILDGPLRDTNQGWCGSVGRANAQAPRIYIHLPITKQTLSIMLQLYQSLRSIVPRVNGVQLPIPIAYKNYVPMYLGRLLPLEVTSAVYKSALDTGLTCATEETMDPIYAGPNSQFWLSCFIGAFVVFSLCHVRTVSTSRLTT